MPRTYTGNYGPDLCGILLMGSLSKCRRRVRDSDDIDVLLLGVSSLGLRVPAQGQINRYQFQTELKAQMKPRTLTLVQEMMNLGYTFVFFWGGDSFIRFCCGHG